MVWSGRPSGRWRISSPDSIAPTERLTLRTSCHELHLLAALDGGRHFSISLTVQRPVEAVVLHVDLARGTSAGTAGRWNTRLKSRPRAFQCAMPLRVSSRSARPIRSSKLADAQLRHDLARFLGDEEEVVDDMLGLARELGAQHRVLRGHAHRAGVQVALAHHDAALGHQRRGGEAELVGAQQRTDHDVAAGLHLAVGLHADAAAQAVEHQGLLRLGQAQLPGRAGVLDAAPGRRARAAVMAGDHHMVGLALGHAGRDRAHAHFGPA